MGAEEKSNKPSIHEELRQWFNAAPRVWLVLGIGLVLAIFLGFIFGVLFMLVAFY
jgi:hypothetical protein